MYPFVNHVAHGSLPNKHGIRLHRLIETQFVVTGSEFISGSGLYFFLILQSSNTLSNADFVLLSNTPSFACSIIHVFPHPWAPKLPVNCPQFFFRVQGEIHIFRFQTIYK